MAADLKEYQTMKDERRHIKHTLPLQRKLKKLSQLSQLRSELEELQKKYAQLCAQVAVQNVKNTE